MNHNCSRNRRAHRYAFTLVEVIIAMSVMSLIALGVVTLMVMQTNGVSDPRDMRRRCVGAAVTSARVSDKIHLATKLMGVSSDGCVIWTGDANSDGKANLSELCALMWEADTQAILAYVVDPVPTSVADTAFLASVDFMTLAKNQIDSGLWSGEILIPQVESCTFWGSTNAVTGRSILRIDVYSAALFMDEPLCIIAAIRGEVY